MNMPIRKKRHFATPNRNIQLAPISDFALPKGRILAGKMLDDVKALQDSIETLGLLSPLIVTRRGSQLIVIDGKKRLAALRRLRFMGRLPRHLVRIPFIYFAEAESRESPVPVLLSNHELYESVIGSVREGASIDDIAAGLYLTRKSVRDILTIDRLASSLRTCFFNGNLEFTQARALAALPSHSDQLAVFDRAGAFASEAEIIKIAKTVTSENRVEKLFQFALAA